VAKRQSTNDQLKHFVGWYVEYSLCFLPLPTPGEGETWEEGDFFGDHFGVDDLTAKSLQKVKVRCREFLRRASPLLDGNNSKDRDAFGRAGCDLAFTDVGYGDGFAKERGWDDKVAERLRILAGESGGGFDFEPANGKVHA
jgi:hypothetical protein